MSELAVNGLFGCRARSDTSFSFEQELKIFFEKRQQELGFSDEFLADHFAICGRSCALRVISRFHKGFKIKPSFMLRLQQLLCIGDEQLHAFSRAFNKKAYAARNFFFANLHFFMEHEAEINSCGAYKNVLFYGMHVPALLFRRTDPLTLGELLSHYQSGLFVIQNLAGHDSYIYRIVSIDPAAVTVDCFDDVSKIFFRTKVTSGRGQIISAFLNFRPEIAFRPSAWTVNSLASHLKNSDGIGEPGDFYKIQFRA